MQMDGAFEGLGSVSLAQLPLSIADERRALPIGIESFLALTTINWVTTLFPIDASETVARAM